MFLRGCRSIWIGISFVEKIAQSLTDKRGRELDPSKDHIGESTTACSPEYASRANLNLILSVGRGFIN
ncbi:unnamed protein product, partial [Nesidiocoris tenuis]